MTLQTEFPLLETDRLPHFAATLPSSLSSSEKTEFPANQRRVGPISFALERADIPLWCGTYCDAFCSCRKGSVPSSFLLS